MPEALKARLHAVRCTRNEWVHVRDPHDHERLIDAPSAQEAALERVAFDAMRLLRELIYREQFT